ncbi:PIG-L deacetylase family protein [Pandoraea sputorum]|uniref:PIG-L deacetylase family protein n=1 Tax=Pandoraea sputorum TaxID=93222 RepID=UPI001782E620
MQIHIWAVTDGDASHPGSSQWPPARLAEARPRESLAAQQRLSLPCPRHRLGLPDGQIVRHESRRFARGCAALSRGGTVVAPWQRDGHPDHEAVARACRRAWHRGADLGLALGRAERQRSALGARRARAPVTPRSGGEAPCHRRVPKRAPPRPQHWRAAAVAALRARGGNPRSRCSSYDGL